MPITHPGRFGARAGIGALAIALSVTAIACGGDSTPKPTGTPTSVATEAAPAATTAAPVSTVVGTEEATPVMPSTALPSPTPSTGPVTPLETASPMADRAVGTGVGDLAPDFTLTTPSGEEITLSSLREQGRPFLLISFTTW